MPDQTLGIIDLGGARFKSSAYVLSPEPRAVWRTSSETGEFVKAGDADALRESLRGLVATTRDRADRVLAYGAGLLRQQRWHDELVPMLADLVDDYAVLDPQQEGQLLLLAAQRSGGSASHLVDIGGESVQLVTAGTVDSWPVGTFAMEREWGLTQGSPVEAYEAVARDLRQKFDLQPAKGSRLAIGTGLMDEFMAGLARFIDVAQPGEWTLDDLERAWRFCAVLPQDRFTEVFPTKATFMYGADKAMLIAWVVASQLAVEAAHGTAVSVMDGMAWREAGQTVID